MKSLWGLHFQEWNLCVSLEKTLVTGLVNGSRSLDELNCAPKCIFVTNILLAKVQSSISEWLKLTSKKLNTGHFLLVSTRTVCGYSIITPLCRCWSESKLRVAYIQSDCWDHCNNQKLLLGLFYQPIEVFVIIFHHDIWWHVASNQKRPVLPSYILFVSRIGLQYVW